MFKKLRFTFWHTATESRQHEPENKPDTKKAQLDSLIKWMGQTTDHIIKTAASIKSTAEKDGITRNYEYKTDCIDFDQFTREDLKALKPALCALHDACKKQDVAIDLSGFDFLPRVAMVSSGGWSLNRDEKLQSFMISIDGRHGYNYVINPYSDQELAAEFERDQKSKPQEPRL